MSYPLQRAIGVVFVFKGRLSCLGLLYILVSDALASKHPTRRAGTIYLASFQNIQENR